MRNDPVHHFPHGGTKAGGVLRACRLGILAVAAALLAGMLGGCNIISLGRAILNEQKAEEEVVLTSTDGRYQLTVPGDWTDAGASLNEQAILAAYNPQKEKYAVVLAESREDFYDDVTARDYMDVLIEQMSWTVEDMTFTPAETVTVGGREGYLSRIDGAVDGLKVTYWLTCVETSADFVQITAWTLQSKAEEYEEEFRRVGTSLQEAA
ncbi:MAG TPA: hypothetical protein H9684_05850 [Firmicutes bacterium]|nr:hypothetical protein [Bacillota bacterium]